MGNRPPEEPYERLRRLIYTNDRRTEIECKEFLNFVKPYLFTETFIEEIYCEAEYRGHSGDSDFVISAKVESEGGDECIKAYIWEVKAPQLYVFEKDNENRLCPTIDLFKAENQLLNYFHENKGSTDFCKTFSTHPDDVHMGGIIIGRQDNRVNGDYSEEKKARLYGKAYNLRKEYVWNKLNIRVIIWDKILDQLYRPGITTRVESESEIVLPTPIVKGEYSISGFTTVTTDRKI